MKLTLGIGRVVHSARLAGSPECGVTPSVKFLLTDNDVTCKRCLKVLSDQEEHAARTAYHAGLRDGQDGDLSQAPVDTEPQQEEAAKPTTGACCDHAPMHHGVRGCDSCACKMSRYASEGTQEKWLSITLNGVPYMIGPRRDIAFPGTSFVEYWPMGVRRYVQRAYADALPGSTSRYIWDMQRAVR